MQHDRRRAGKTPRQEEEEEKSVSARRRKPAYSLYAQFNPAYLGGLRISPMQPDPPPKKHIYTHIRPHTTPHARAHTKNIMFLFTQKHPERQNRSCLHRSYVWLPSGGESKAIAAFWLRGRGWETAREGVGVRGVRGGEMEAKAGGEDNTVLQCSNGADKHFYFAGRDVSFLNSWSLLSRCRRRRTHHGLLVAPCRSCPSRLSKWSSSWRVAHER